MLLLSLLLCSSLLKSWLMSLCLWGMNWAIYPLERMNSIETILFVLLNCTSCAIIMCSVFSCENNQTSNDILFSWNLVQLSIPLTNLASKFPFLSYHTSEIFASLTFTMVWGISAPPQWWAAWAFLISISLWVTLARSTIMEVMFTAAPIWSPHNCRKQRSLVLHHVGLNIKLVTFRFAIIVVPYTIAKAPVTSLMVPTKAGAFWTWCCIMNSAVHTSRAIDVSEADICKTRWNV